MSSVVYFVRAGTGEIKIGVAVNVTRRLATLQTSSPSKLQLLGVCAGGVTFEAELHEMFREERRSGEWFLASDRLLGWIEKNTTDRPVSMEKRRETDCRYTQEALHWLRIIVQHRKKCIGITQGQALKVVSRELEWPDHSTGDLMKGRTREISVSQYFAMRDLFMLVAQEMSAKLSAQIVTVEQRIAARDALDVLILEARRS